MVTITDKRKITIRETFGVPEKLKEGDSPIHILNVYGILHSVREVDDKYKPGETSISLYGDMEAVNMVTGEIFSAPKAFLPASILDEVVKAFKANKHNSIIFAYSIHYKNSPHKPGYVYVCRQLAPITVHDPFASVRVKTSRVIK